MLVWGLPRRYLLSWKDQRARYERKASSRHHQTRERHHRGRSSRVRETTRESESSSRVPPSSSRVPSHPEADSPRPPHTENYRGIIIKIWTSPQRKASISGCWIATKKTLKHGFDETNPSQNDEGDERGKRVKSFSLNTNFTDVHGQCRTKEQWRWLVLQQNQICMVKLRE